MKDGKFDFRFTRLGEGGVRAGLGIDSPSRSRAIFDLRFEELKILTASWFILSLAVASLGCSRYPGAPWSASAGHPYYQGTSKRLQNIRTACVVELYNKTAYPQIAGDVTESFYQALQKKHLFDLSLLRQGDAAWRNLPIHPDSPHTLEQLLATRKMLGVDAVLTGTVTSYSPYPHTMLGLRLKLIDLRDGQTVWAIEQIWDTADKATEERIKKYFEQQLRSGFSPLGEQLAVLSSINFIRFVTYDVAETLN
jgi:hypothetical protein